MAGTFSILVSAVPSPVSKREDPPTQPRRARLAGPPSPQSVPRSSPARPGPPGIHPPRSGQHQPPAAQPPPPAHREQHSEQAVRPQHGPTCRDDEQGNPSSSSCLKI